ncbi:MAG TPA: hypothetical protein K8V84_21620 [Nocardiopsis listeri]|uniref:hypothetical protein n=1 Tax=Nocardiopsis listeri TaxID=53440 RepID=UPI001DA78DF2|nr:hypothetical protein [Nocardiopsis listeri]HJE61081.1 hypothetical protein [Nocardiopsis listeri]
MTTARKGIEATLDLLWTGLGRPGRGPRHRLTVQRVVEAAMNVVESEGVEVLSMRKVAAPARPPGNLAGEGRGLGP